MLHAEYQRFLQSLNFDDVSPGVCKIANLVFGNLEELASLSTHQGQRIKRIVALATEQWGTLSTTITPPEDPSGQRAPTVDQLTQLSVGPFRGFARQEIFDLSSKLILIYGPNGTGKSSFCEALEFSLLGTVSEAQSKRFRNQSDYCRNAHTDSFSPPELVGLTSQGEQRLVEPDEPLYRFCFVEKNRIDDFARIAAQAPAKQTELISTLFGLDSFNDFVRNFSQEIDEKYIDLIGKKTTELRQRRQQLASHDQQIESGRAELAKIEEEESELARKYCEGKPFQQMDVEIHGEEENTGTISQLEEQLQQPAKRKSNLTTESLATIAAEIRGRISDLNSKQHELTDASEQVSFKTMYEALSQLQSLDLDSCPACKTPLDQVQVNPFTNATEELENLRHLSELQEAEKRIEQQVNQALSKLCRVVKICCEWVSPNVLDSFNPEPDSTITTAWWDSLNQQLENGSTPFENLESQVQELETKDSEIENEVQSRSSKHRRLAELRDFSQKIAVLKSRKQTANQLIKTVEEARADFDRENAQLIAAAEAESSVVETNKNIAESYAEFVKLLNAYKEKLPGQLIADLGDRIVNLYNAFNRNDATSEKLAEVKLPLAQNQRLELSFQNDTKTLFDALHILSEGHIRCIGLSILLAKNLKEGCPILIFDDPVNAIDDDHRDSIRRTIFEDQYFSEKQIILTCHGEEFFKDVSNILPAQSVAQSKTMTFLPRLDEAHIRVDFNCSPRNYVIAARSHFERNEIRDALTKSRQALETLTKKIWRYVNKHGDGNLSIKLRGPSAPIELRNLSDQLRKQIAKDDFRDQEKHLVHNPLNTLLGLSGDSREWRYLNKGVHEEDNRTEFDRHTVHQIIEQLEAIDTALS